MLVYLELPQHIDQNASVKHGLAVRSCDEVLYLLEGEASEFLHDLGCPLHLLSLKREQRLFSIVKLLEVASTNSQSLKLDISCNHITHLVATLSKML